MEGEFGKNAWLVHNSALEDLLHGYERELVRVREEVGRVNLERKGFQEQGRGRMEVGEREWREGVGRVLEVGVGVRGVEEGVRGLLRRGA